MTAKHYNKAEFQLSAQFIGQLPDDRGLEVAFAGRSNSGKSSVINTLTQQKSLARTSKTPGRTQLINFFPIDDERRIVDLPGYGYAKVPLALKDTWGKVLNEYVETRKCLVGLILITDIRRGLTDYDVQMLEWLHGIGHQVHILLNKADKLSRNKAMQSMYTIRKEIDATGFSLQLFSALNKSGLEELREKLDIWYEY